jgi:hypothetical protein
MTPYEPGGREFDERAKPASHPSGRAISQWSIPVTPVTVYVGWDEL